MAEFDPDKFLADRAETRPFDPDEFLRSRQREPEVGWGGDIVKGAAGGLGRGVTGLAGLPGDVSNLMARGGEWIGNKLGLAPLPEDVRAANERSRPFTSAEVRAPVEAVTGKFYEPKTVPGQYFSTAAEFAPGAIFGGGGAAARTLGTIVPAALSESAGQITKGQDIEPYARFAGGVIGGVTAGKAITPSPPPTRARQKAAAVLDREDIPMTAGDITGSKTVQRLEDAAGVMPFSSGRMQQIRQDQLAAANRVVTDRMFSRPELERRGIPAESHLPDTDVFVHGKQSLKDIYDDIARRNAPRADPQFINETSAALAKYEANVLPTQRAGGKLNVEHNINDIVDKFVAGGGQMSGEAYQSIRSRLGKQAKDVRDDSALSGALREIQGALDRNMQRSLSPADKAAWIDTNRRYAIMKQLEPLVAKGGEFMTPAGMAQAARSGRAAQAAAGTGDLDELTKAMNLIIKPLPSSGTAERTAWLRPTNFINPLNYIARAVVSRLGQAYLGNRIPGQAAANMSTRDRIAQTLAQQAISRRQQEEGRR
jgi:hypothetical protein